MEHLPELAEAAGKMGIQSYLVYQVLGPPAKAVGSSLESLVQFCATNVGQIFRNAGKKLGPGLQEAGSVPPRVLARIIDDGAYAEDTLIVDYLGGVLASAKTAEGRDDRGAMWSSQVGRMSTYQIRTHYIFYTILGRLIQNDMQDLGAGKVRPRCRTLVPISLYQAAMEISTSHEATDIASHSLNGLSREGLLGAWTLGNSETWPSIGVTSTELGFVAEPTLAGIELYLSAHGRGTVNPARFAFVAGSLPPLEIAISISDGASLQPRDVSAGTFIP